MNARYTINHVRAAALERELGVEREDYVNACRFAGCDLEIGRHYNCGSQFRLWRGDELLYDSADEPNWMYKS